jgi:5'-deoxynucleotidase YfbR-like HD superfamily hydrolase
LTPPSQSTIDAAVRYLYEVGQLKLSKRTGWWHAGIAEPESVAEHTFRTAIIGYVLAVLEHADPNVTAALCLFHDVLETRIGDIPRVAKAYVSHEPDVRIAADQVVGMPPPARDAILGAVAEYVGQESPEALLAKDADRLECLMQAREYEHQGFRNTRPWMDSNLAGLRSPSARALAERALTLPPDEWWKVFAEARDGS